MVFSWAFNYFYVGTVLLLFMQLPHAAHSSQRPSRSEPPMLAPPAHHARPPSGLQGKAAAGRAVSPRILSEAPPDTPGSLRSARSRHLLPLTLLTGTSSTWTTSRRDRRRAPAQRRRRYDRAPCPIVHTAVRLPTVGLGMPHTWPSMGRGCMHIHAFTDLSSSLRPRCIPAFTWAGASLFTR